jgi:hypothetical protein
MQTLHTGSGVDDPRRRLSQYRGATRQTDGRLAGVGSSEKNILASESGNDKRVGGKGMKIIRVLFDVLAITVVLGVLIVCGRGDLGAKV